MWEKQNNAEEGITTVDPLDVIDIDVNEIISTMEVRTGECRPLNNEINHLFSQRIQLRWVKTFAIE